MNYKQFAKKRLSEIERQLLKEGKEFREAKQAQKPAREFLRDYLKDNLDRVPEEIREPLAVLFLQTKREQRALSPANRFLECFTEDNPVMTGLTAFSTFGLGRRECETAINRALRFAKPKERKWIDFTMDDKGGVYTLLSTDQNPPENWPGFIPDETIDITIK